MDTQSTLNGQTSGRGRIGSNSPESPARRASRPRSVSERTLRWVAVVILPLLSLAWSAYNNWQQTALRRDQDAVKKALADAQLDREEARKTTETVGPEHAKSLAAIRQYKYNPRDAMAKAVILYHGGAPQAYEQLLSDINSRKELDRAALDKTITVSIGFMKKEVERTIVFSDDLQARFYKLLNLKDREEVKTLLGIASGKVSLSNERAARYINLGWELIKDTSEHPDQATSSQNADLADLVAFFRTLKENYRKNHATTPEINNDLIVHGREIIDRYINPDYGIKVRWDRFRNAMDEFVPIAETQIDRVRSGQVADVKKLRGAYDHVSSAAAAQSGAKWYDEMTRRAELIVMTLEMYNRFPSR